MPDTPPLSRQLDIFEDSPEVMLRNDLIDALLQRDSAAAWAACRQLAIACPADVALPAMRLLVEALQQQSDTPLGLPDEVAHARRRLIDEIAPAAKKVLNQRDTERFLQPFWRLLASRCRAVPYQAQHADDHAAALWLNSESWAEAVSAVQGIESWRRIPTPLAWMAKARCRLGDIDGCWALLAELAWLSPRRFHSVVHSARDPLLMRLHKKFGSSFDGEGSVDDLAWFPAWVLTEAPSLAGPLSLALASQDTPAERGMRLLVDLLGVERQGRHAELIERRRGLRDLSPPLWTAYMATR